jgi:PadR family transcriptional regulator
MSRRESAARVDRHLTRSVAAAFGIPDAIRDACMRQLGVASNQAPVPLHFYMSRPSFSIPVEGQRVTERPADMTDHLDLPQGTLDLLILKSLSLGAMHGWAISERLQQVSRDVLSVPQGSLYPALHRLERRGWIAAEWGTSDNNRKAKYYTLTRAGRKQLTAETDAWAKLTKAVALVLDMS